LGGVLVLFVAVGGFLWFQHLQTRGTTLRVPQQFDSINAALSEARSGTIIEVDAAGGPYLESLNVNVEGITLKSVNGRATLRSRQEGEPAIKVEANDVVVNGFEISSKGPCVEVFSAARSRVEHNTLTGCEVAIAVRKANFMLLQRNVIQGNKNGVSLLNADNNRVCDNDISNNENNGVEVQASLNNVFCNNAVVENYIGVIITDSDDNQFFSNTIQNNKMEGVYLENSNRNVFSKNDITLNYDGFSLNLNSNKNRLLKNVVRANRQSGVRLLHVEHNKVSSNKIEGNEQGISLINAAHNLVDRNRVNTNRDGGIVLQNASQNTLRENVLSDNDRGIALRPGDNNMLVDNRINRNTIGIYMTGSSGNSLQSNELTSNKTGFEIGFSEKNLIKDNRIAQHVAAILVTESKKNTFVSNRFTDNQYGINFLYANDNTVLFNTFERQAQTAVSLINFSENNLIGQNTLHRNKWGILLSSSSHNQLELNTIDQNEVGIVLNRSGTRTAIKGNWISNNGVGLFVPEFLTKDETILSESSIVLEVVGSDEGYLIRTNRFSHNRTVDVRNDKNSVLYVRENLWDMKVTATLPERSKRKLVAGNVELIKARLKGPIFVTSASDAEQRVLGAMVRLLLEANGYAVVDMTNLGNEQEVFRAFADNVVDVGWSSTGSALERYQPDQVETLPNEPSILERFVAQQDRSKYNLLWTNCAPADTSLVLAISLSSEFAVKSYGLDLSSSDPITVSDVVRAVNRAKVTPIIALPKAFLENKLRFEAFIKRYGLNIDNVHIKSLSLQEAVSELSVGSVDLALIRNTAPEIKVLGLRVLDDDLNYFWKSRLCLTLRKEMAKAFPQVVTLLTPLSKRLTLTQLRALLGKVAFFGQTPESVASQFLSDQGLTP